MRAEPTLGDLAPPYATQRVYAPVVEPAHNVLIARGKRRKWTAPHVSHWTCLTPRRPRTRRRQGSPQTLWLGPEKSARADLTDFRMWCGTGARQRPVTDGEAMKSPKSHPKSYKRIIELPNPAQPRTGPPEGGAGWTSCKSASRRQRDLVLTPLAVRRTRTEAEARLVGRSDGMDCNRCHQTGMTRYYPRALARHPTVIVADTVSSVVRVRDNLDTLHPTLKRIRRGRRGGLV